MVLSVAGQPAGGVQGLRGQLQSGPGDGREVQPGQQPVPEDIRGESPRPHPRSNVFISVLQYFLKMGSTHLKGGLEDQE